MLYILLSAYNEEKNLPVMFEEIIKQHWEIPYTIVLVNDGSTDDTKGRAEEYAKRLPLVLIGHPSNRGLGCALATGFSYLSERIKDDDLVVTMDADDTHPVELVPVLQAKLEKSYDIVIASRFYTGGMQTGVPLYRSLLSSCAKVVLRNILKIRGVTDYTSGYRMFSGKLLKQAFASYGENFVTEKGFSATLEILLKLSRITGNIGEVPLHLRYERKIGASKMRVLQNIARYIILLGRK